MDLAPVTVGFLYLGSFFPAIMNIVKRVHVITLLIVFVLAFCLNIRYFGPSDGYVVNMCQGQFGSGILFTVAALSGSIITLYLSSRIKTKELLFWGQNTLIIYGLHNIFKDIYPMIIKKAMLLTHIYEPTVIMDSIVGLITFVLLMLSMIPIINVVNKRFTFILGKF